MVEVIPSINVPTFTEVQERVKKVEPYVKWCHLDVTDGVFSKHITWNNPGDLSSLQTSLSVEVHLMVAEPEKVIDRWLIKPVKRVIVHLEAFKNSRHSLFFELVEKIPFLYNRSRFRSNNTLELIIQKCHNAGIKIGLAINPETPAEGLNPWLEKVDLVQVLAVHPGPSGQEVNWPLMLGKIVHIREACPQCIIEADGGINPETAKGVKEAGANILIAGNYIFSHPSPKMAIKDPCSAN